MDTSNPTALLLELCRQGVGLRVTSDRRRIAAPSARLTPELRAALIAHKTQLLDLLSRMEAYRGMLQRAFARLGAGKGPTPEECQQFADEQIRYLDELGPSLLTIVFEATADAWRESMGTCPWCGARGACDHPAPHRRN
jgi:hypothetical protein